MLAQSEISEDDSLIQAAVLGDRGAFGELYVKYARMVHGILLARVPPGEAEDLVQDVFMSAMRQLRGLRTAYAFRGWLGAIARNRAIDYFRDARHRVPLEDNTPDRSESAGDDAFAILETIKKLPE